MAEDEGWSSQWGTRSFADVVLGKQPPLTFYTGEGEDDIIDDLGMANVIDMQTDVESSPMCPVVDIPWDIYRTLWTQWLRALILKVLG